MAVITFQSALKSDGKIRTREIKWTSNINQDLPGLWRDLNSKITQSNLDFVIENNILSLKKNVQKKSGFLKLLLEDTPKIIPQTSKSTDYK